MNATERSSSNDLSSAPNSDVEGPASAHNLSNTIIVSRALSSNRHSSPNPGLKSNAGQSVGGVEVRQDPAPKQRKPRKKKDDNTSTPTEKKEKGTRRPRGASTAGGSSTRKKIKTENSTPTPAIQSAPPPAEPVFTRSTNPSLIDLTAQPNTITTEAAKFSQNGFLNNALTMQAIKPAPPQYSPTPLPPLPPPQAPIVRSTTYDPIRGTTVSRSTEPPPSSNLSHPNISTPPRPAYNPSTSPAISSIINPPEYTTIENKISTPSYQPQSDLKIQQNISTTKPNEDSSAMDVDPPSVKIEPTKKVTPETAPTKPATKPRAKEQPPPLPTGSGLLSSTLFGGDSGMDAKNSNDKGTSIVLHINLKDPNNKVINFARMAEEKYGFAALYPRQAAQKERLAKVAAAGAALERAGASLKGTPAGESGDEDVSVDIDRDSDNDGDVAMSGMNGTGEAVNSGTDGPAPKRRKRKDEYDADDPFVDDSELLWEAQAAASKDGFFVYCGPLVPEGEKPTVERADGTVKRGRGRGRGGGPGSRGGRGGAAAARDAEGGSNRGGGPGSRGGGITRKPRITKAERQQRELEKKQREQMAVLAAKPPNYQP